MIIQYAYPYPQSSEDRIVSFADHCQFYYAWISGISLSSHESCVSPLEEKIVSSPNSRGDAHYSQVNPILIKWLERYQDDLPPNLERTLERVISMVQCYVNSLSDDSQKNKAAKRCVLSFTAPDDTLTDPGSQITTRPICAVTFLAISDAGNPVGSLEDASGQFVEGFDEIQRGDKLSDTGVDQRGHNRSIFSIVAQT